MSLPYAAAYAFTFVDCLIVIGIIGCRLVDIIVFLPSWSNKLTLLVVVVVVANLIFAGFVVFVVWSVVADSACFAWRW